MAHQRLAKKIVRLAQQAIVGLTVFFVIEKSIKIG